MRVVIFGCGENGVQAYMCLRHDPNTTVVGFLDDNASRHGSTYLGLPILGGTSSVAALRAEQTITGAIVAIGDNATRRRVTFVLKELGLKMVTAIHPTVLQESPKHIGEGSIIEMGAAIHPEAVVGDGVFLGGGSIVSHHSTVGDFTMIGGGVVFGGRVHVGSETLIGVGASIKPHISIGSRVTVGVGAAVITDLPDDVIAVGVPARIISRQSK